MATETTPDFASLLEEDPLLQQLAAANPVFWQNPALQLGADYKQDFALTSEDTAEAAARLQRFASWIADSFPETQEAQGLIESPLRKVATYKAALEKHYGEPLSGNLLLKCDSHLPVSGSIKARGGIYEVLKYAETVALEAGLLKPEQSYRSLADPRVHSLFAEHAIVVGSTGNLGLSIGIIGAALGFRVTVHMSADAREWKKALLREKGVEVIEYADDYSRAVEEGRKQALTQANTHFVDDENSTDLFLGYSVAGQRLKQQFQQQGISVDAEHPLFVYLPCGVGGGPGGVAFGLKQAFGEHVHCFFAEPTHSPCMLLGMHTGLQDQISVQDIGLDNHTVADGLAVGRASGFVGRFISPMLSGIYTETDEELFRLLALLAESEGLILEPSALAGVAGIKHLNQASNPYMEQNQLQDKLAQANHLIWATGGSMVPTVELDAYLQKGRELLQG
ncbi:D-serine ammonia-lyase [uncultured Neptuniibacter sp.]|uniref:D-serine ammonia-lyase n=1 Tax=uncultured Neptuniibacter sp. TaxID=502143 RepID=UPI0026386510|nr:D-serine ammonia-lyase [uncultured Neptuniibacter sp.]